MRHASDEWIEDVAGCALRLWFFVLLWGSGTEFGPGQALSHFAEARGQDIVCAAGDVVRTVDSMACAQTMMLKLCCSNYDAQTVMLKLCSTSTVTHSYRHAFVRTPKPNPHV